MKLDNMNDYRLKDYKKVNFSKHMFRLAIKQPVYRKYVSFFVFSSKTAQ